MPKTDESKSDLSPEQKVELSEAIARSVAAVKTMTPAEREAMHAAQRRSWVRAELAFGSDADEARYRDAGDVERECLAAWMSARADWVMSRSGL